MADISLKINQNKLMANLKLSFSDRFKLLAELAQNGRRAGASRIAFTYDLEQKVLRVSDDGCGVGDFQNLLTVAESGWDEQVREDEHPFGLGFLATLFSCPKVVVKSCAQQAVLESEKIIAGEPVTLEPCADAPKVGTLVELSPFELCEKELAKRLAQLACGFSLPITYNGDLLHSPHALGGERSFVACEIGHASLYGIHHGKKGVASSRRIYYLQGVKVAEAGSRIYDGPNVDIVHLDSRSFFARMPDRDTLVDCDKAEKRVRETRERIWREHLEAEFAAMAPEEFADTYLESVEKFAPEMLSRLPFIPAKFLATVEDAPFLALSGEGFIAWAKKHLYRTDLESGKIRLAAEPMEIEEEGVGIEPWMYLFATGLAFLEKRLPKDHWCHKHLIDLDERKWRVEIIGESAREKFCGEFCSDLVILCEKFRLCAEGLEPVEFQKDAIIAEQGIVVPAKEGSGFVVRQICSYCDEWGVYLESEAEEDMWKLEVFVRNLRENDPARMMESIISGDAQIGDFPALRGKRLNVTIADDGQFQVEMAA